MNLFTITTWHKIHYSQQTAIFTLELIYKFIANIAFFSFTDKLLHEIINYLKDKGVKT